MRKDFDEVVRERGRYRRPYRGGTKWSRERNLPPEDRPRKSVVSRGSPDQNRGPLRRFFSSQVGRKWDEVYSEICRANDPRSDPRPYIFDYIQYSIHLRPMVDDDGVLWEESGRFRLEETPSNLDGRLYVHPETGTLCVSRQVPRWRPVKKKREYVVVSPLSQYHRIRGIWYLVEFRHFDDGRSYTDILFPVWNEDMPLRRDGKRHAQLDPHERRDLGRMYGAAIYAVGKQQAGKKEIRWIEDRIAGRRTRRF